MGMVDLKALYQNNYFHGRQSDDHLRQASYQQEAARIHSFTGLSHGSVLDIGCGNGGFLDCFPSEQWKKYGIEISEFAMEKARAKGISFDLPDAEECFDLIIYRGSIQHLPKPFESIFDSYRRLKPGGWIVFLATPNIGGLVYRIWQDHPALEPKYNFALFSDRIMRQTLENVGFKNLKFYFPYLDSPYAKPAMDHLRFLLRLVTNKRFKFAFWRNMMECYAQK